MKSKFGYKQVLLMGFYGCLFVAIIMLGNNRNTTSVSAADIPPIFQDGEWTDTELYYENFSNFDTVENIWGDVLLKTEDYFHWIQTWTGHFSDGAFYHTETISDGVQLSPISVGQYYMTGTYTSSVFNATRSVDWLGANWAHSGSFDAVSLEYRTGDISVPDETWTQWTNAKKEKYTCSYAGFLNLTECYSVLSNVQSSQYIQYRSFFTNTATSTTITLFDINTTYGVHYLTGTAVSIVINPIDLHAWQSVFFTASIPISTALTIDVLSSDDSILLSDITSGTNLDTLDPQQYPAIKLRATFSTTQDAVTPILESWGIKWHVAKRLFLPLIIK